MKRILTIGHSYVVEQNRRLGHEMARAGRGRWEVTIAAPTAVAGEPHARRLSVDAGEPCEVRPLRLRLAGHPHVRFYTGGLGALLREPWDVVHLWQEPYVMAAAQVAARLPSRARFVPSTFQNIPKRYPAVVRLLERCVMTRADGWIAFAEGAHRAQSRKPAYAAKPVRIIPPGVDVDHYRPDPERRARTRRAFGIEASEPVVGFVGRFVPEKGIEVLLGALERMRTPWRAIVVGRGPLDAMVFDAARRYHGRVHVVTDAGHGRVPGLINAMDVLCAPSKDTPAWREQFGRMLIEAMACGVPVIAAPAGEIPHVVGDAGVLVAGADAAAWARAVDGLLVDRAERDRLAAAGLQRVRHRFAWSVVAARHLEFFDALLEGEAA